MQNVELIGVTDHAEGAGNTSTLANEEEVVRRISELTDEDVVIMVVGQPNKGKSTLLNNLFDLSLPTGAHAGTTKDVCLVKEVSVDKAKKVSTDEAKKVSTKKASVYIFDTPGLFEVKQNTKRVLKEMKKYVKPDTNFTLLYCLSVGPGQALVQQDTEMVLYLTDTFGEDVWKRCVLALTFSDLVRQTECPLQGNTEYISHLKEHITQFQEVLGIFALPIKLLFELSPDEDMSNCIVAIPVAKTKDKGEMWDIWPEYKMETPLNWTDYAFIELVRKSGRHSVALASFRYPGIAGAVVGGILGSLAGPDGAILGSVIGAAIVIKLKRGSDCSFEDIRDKVKYECGRLKRNVA